jgi:hypothetical protein
MDPGLAGLALIPTTLPIVAVAPLAGRWYDRVGGRVPLTAGFATLPPRASRSPSGSRPTTTGSCSPVSLLFGVGLALVLTVNDPVCLDTLPEPAHGQASGVSATAEQFGGAVGISVLYLLFHATYVSRLHTNIGASPLADLTGAQYAQLKADLIAAEQTGLHPASFDRTLVGYLKSTLDASNWGLAAAFLATSVLSIVGLLVVWRMVRSPAAGAARSGVARLPVANEPIEPGD